MASGWRRNGRPTDLMVYIQAQADEYLRRQVMQIVQEVVTSSPVDTGAFRGNHRLSIGSIPSGYDMSSTDTSGADTIARAQHEVLSARIGDTIYIYNNLPYAIPLENGHSRQAPLGIYTVALMNALRR